jgi:hypothetical protein
MKLFGAFICICIGISLDGRGQAVSTDKISLPTHIAKGQRETNYMKDSLNLTATQVAQVDIVNKSFLKNISLLETQGISIAGRRQKIAEYKATRETDLQGILTAQQFLRYKDLMKAQEDRMKSRLQSY